MAEMVIDNKLIKKNGPPFVIAEIGHNHQGNIDSALKLIYSAAATGASAAKFQKRDNRSLFTPELYNQTYNSENAFGKTYGEHREALEFGLNEYKICISEAKRAGITFFATAFDFKSADFLNKLEMPAFKIASGDLQNLPLLKYVADFKKPMIISTGGANFKMIHNAVETIRTVHNEFAILQCTASYPAKFEHLNLKVITRLTELYPENIIGYSGHDNGIAMAVVAYTLGARIIEKHFTRSRKLNGPDQSSSIEPEQLKELIDYKNKIYIFNYGHDPKIKNYPEDYDLRDAIVRADFENNNPELTVTLSDRADGSYGSEYGAFDKDTGEYLKYSDLDKIGKIV
jgi:N-acetylneuraminate synthase/sialic acid synthase